MAGDKNQFAVGRPLGGPLQEMFDLHRLTVLVDAEDRHIEIVPRELEVVGIAAEECDRKLRSEDQSHVGVFLVAIEVIRASLIQRDDVAAEFCLLGRFLFDVRDRRRPCCLSLFRRFGRDRFVDAVGDVHDLDKLIEFQIRRGDFIGWGLREKAVAVVVVLGRRNLRERVGRDMMIGQHEPAARHERARSAGVESHRRAHQMVRPSGWRLEAVSLFQDLRGQLVVDPHAFVGTGCVHRPSGKSEQNEHQTLRRARHLGKLLRLKRDVDENDPEKWL